MPEVVVYAQSSYDVRLDWGPIGAAAVTADVMVVVDVLSFSTTVTVAVERGMQVFPFAWKGERAEAFAEEHQAVLAVGRLEAARSGRTAALSLSPAHILKSEPVPRMVLPSPNGSTIVSLLAESNAEVVVGCLRNARAVGVYLAEQLHSGRTIGIVAAGERWAADDSLRPALEDQLGAGAILAALVVAAPEADLSPEAQAAAVLFVAMQTELSAHLRDCVGGRELAALGFDDDVWVAADRDASAVIPTLQNGRLVG